MSHAREHAAAMTAIAEFHSLLVDGGGAQLAADSQGMLDAELARRGLIFGDRPLCTVLRPRLFTPESYRWLMGRITELMGAFGQAYRAAMADAAVRAQFRLTDWEERLATSGPPESVPSPTSRLDAFVVERADGPSTMALTEYNAEVPAGAAFSDSLAEAFLDLPVTRAFARRWHLAPIHARHGVLEALRTSWRRWAETHAPARARTTPRVAILDWEDVPTRREFVMYQDHLRALGIDSVIADPRAADWHDGALWVGGARVDVVYKRVLLDELVREAGVDTPVLRAWRAGAVCMVNPPQSKLLHKKASLAVLTDERNAALFDDAARAVIRASVPWTRVVEERHTELDGARIDLVPHVTRHRERFVLKPNDDYGGAGIVLGWTVDAATWEGAVARALTDPYVVQERVEIPMEPYPSVVDGRVHVVDRMIDTAPFITDGDVADGMLTRLSTAELLNVTAGGGSQVPNFLAMPR